MISEDSRLAGQSMKKLGSQEQTMIHKLDSWWHIHGAVVTEVLRVDHRVLPSHLGFLGLSNPNVVDDIRGFEARRAVDEEARLPGTDYDSQARLLVERVVTEVLRVDHRVLPSHLGFLGLSNPNVVLRYVDAVAGQSMKKLGSQEQTMIHKLDSWWNEWGHRRSHGVHDSGNIGASKPSASLSWGRPSFSAIVPARFRIRRLYPRETEPKTRSTISIPTQRPSTQTRTAGTLASLPCGSDMTLHGEVGSLGELAEVCDLCPF
jgi:hypothetical protein